MSNIVAFGDHLSLGDNNRKPYPGEYKLGTPVKITWYAPGSAMQCEEPELAAPKYTCQYKFSVENTAP